MGFVFLNEMKKRLTKNTTGQKKVSFGIFFGDKAKKKREIFFVALFISWCMAGYGGEGSVSLHGIFLREYKKFAMQAILFIFSRKGLDLILDENQ